MVPTAFASADAENKTWRFFQCERQQHRHERRRRRRLRTKKRKRRAGSGDLSLRCARGVPAHHRKVRELVCPSLGHRKSPDNGHAVPTHEKTVTSRCRERDRSPRSIFSPEHKHVLREIRVSTAHSCANRSASDWRAPAQAAAAFSRPFLQRVPGASARSLRAFFYRSPISVAH